MSPKNTITANLPTPACTCPRLDCSKKYHNTEAFPPCIFCLRKQGKRDESSRKKKSISPIAQAETDTRGKIPALLILTWILLLLSRKGHAFRCRRRYKGSSSFEHQGCARSIKSVITNPGLFFFLFFLAWGMIGAREEEVLYNFFFFNKTTKKKKKKKKIQTFFGACTFSYAEISNLSYRTNSFSESFYCPLKSIFSCFLFLLC